MNKRPEKPRKELTRDGLPKDARDWTEADWADLYHALEKAKRSIAARHRPRDEGNLPGEESGG